MFNYVFKRSEKKYLLSESEYKEILERIDDYMCADDYGLSTICNIYYDTEDFELIRRSIERPCYKEKLRLRSYGVPKDSDTVFTEIKKKYKGVVYKRRVSMNCQEAMDYLEHGIEPSAESQIIHEIDYFIKVHQPEPKVYLAYDRIAYFGREDESVRITFDQNIRSRDYDLDLRMGDYGEPLLEDGIYLMEIKIASAMPMWLVSILSEMKIYPSSFSKYGNVYKTSLVNKSV